MESAAGTIGVITFIISIVILIVFFVMAANLGKCVVILRGMYKELREFNNPSLKEKREI